VIIDDDRATRLARAILADIQLYNAEAIGQASPAVNEAIAEGRALFRSRVDPSLHSVFETALAASSLAAWGAPIDHTYRAPPAPPVVRAPAQSNSQVLALIAIVVLAAGACFFYLATHRH
jgi:hypothetical protein